MEFTQDKPIFQQVAEFIENQILDGLLLPEEQTPSTNEFQKIYEINPATARKGLNLLVDEGIIYKKRGMGMYVSQNAREIILTKRQEEFFNTHIPQIIKELQRLNITPAQLVSEIEKRQTGGK
ncbi:DNA-binding transcriptional regulator YhcF, GntR family [Peptoniphilus asaccharolyticus DSM 20463]|uniref:DNA-binding transcriptional regulator YhcF, GntR family n=1 Tax=Peptoniphilus asaccharolyticus DSM 20463 TaxID=573058 RepID=A0A1W1V4A8_PEPAS|nr:GntR family transcriptional regulator [Peptoniphilus asaccharolyticus]MBL7576300.1 GntR family transcriptional regulator [Peptoniphilus asaccharolyticus]SMB88155.1 DNA-binding transcriptional regulator YhcF, GntR family [Peptoniphilus asaccharolyticus DSM 20463]